MRLEQLVGNMSLAAQSGAIMVRGLTADSRDVLPGYLFAALSGSQTDGTNFVAQAVDRGAVAVLAETPLSIRVPVLTSDNPRRDLALMAVRFFARHPTHLIAVTGTNGKTSTAFFLQQLLAACGHHSASLGTLGVLADGFQKPLVHTTPDPVSLHGVLRDLTAHQVTHVVLEASSHGLAQYRLDGLPITVAGFTNLGHDHLDYHADEAAYLAAKRRLFTELLTADGTAVVNLASAAGKQIATAARAAGRRLVTVGTPEADLNVHITTRGHEGLKLKLRKKADQYDLTLPLIGDFQSENLLLALGMICALEALGALKADWARICAGVSTLKAPPGRLQLVGRKQNGAQVFVDYAHTPDALSSALHALRKHMKNIMTPAAQLRLVFGCGGDRDAGKRPQMGAVAAELADAIVVTDDNPRHENADKIRAAILATCPEAENIADRGCAIEAAIAAAQPEDFVLIAGKGHETGQFIGDTNLPFNDALYACELLVKSGGQDA